MAVKWQSLKGVLFFVFNIKMIFLGFKEKGKEARI